MPWALFTSVALVFTMFVLDYQPRKCPFCKSLDIAKLSYIKFISNLRNKHEPGIIVHTFNPSIWEEEAGGSL